MHFTKQRLPKTLILLILLITIISFGTVATAEPSKDVADIVYINGNIYTVDKDFSKASAFAIKDGQFIYVDSNATIGNYIGKGTKVINLKGNTVLPGLIDSHLHYSGVGRVMQQIDCFWKPKQEILDAVAAAVAKAEPGEWIIGRGWNQEVWDPDVWPTRWDLDAIAPDNPVVLTRVCGHAIWVNSKAMEIANIDANGTTTSNPVGGEILRNAEGTAIGIFTDTASQLITKNKPQDSERQQIEALKLAQDHILSYGITSVRDAGSGSTTINQMKDLYSSGDLKIRVYQMVSSDSASEYYNQPVEERTNLYNDRYNISSLKLMADGSLGARSAWMLEDYSDQPGHTGDPRMTDEEAYTLVKEAAEAGFQVNTHCIGDAANHQILNAYEKVINELGLKDHRFAIEHSQVVALEDIPRFAKLGVIPSMQFVHATSDKNMAEDRVGPERIKGAYAWRKMIDSGSIIPNGTDAPVELVNPYHGLYAAVTRMDRDGEPAGGWYPDECLTKEEALRAYTIWGAYAQFEENDIGSIENGKHADFVIIDRDYMNCTDNELKDINAQMTVIAGEVVYTAPGFSLNK